MPSNPYCLKILRFEEGVSGYQRFEINSKCKNPKQKADKTRGHSIKKCQRGCVSDTLLFCALLIFYPLEPLSTLTSYVLVGCPRIFVGRFSTFTAYVRQEKAQQEWSNQYPDY
jgi:hypothetical protein